MPGALTKPSPGIYYDTLAAANGCDSVVITSISNLADTTFTINTAICFGDSAFAGGGWQTIAGIYYDTLVTGSGCDSIVATTLAVNNSSSSTLTETACNSYNFDGNTLTASGTYYDTLVNASGCDSVITLNLTINNSSDSTMTVTICNSYDFGGNTLTASGTYYDILINASGCDSVITLNLTINNSNGSALTETTCNSYDFGGNTLTASGTYYDTLTNASGCDSVITLNLTINNSNSSVLTETTCNSYDFGGSTLTASGTYYDTLINALGCDSIVTLNLTVLQDVSANVNKSICEGDSIMVNGTWLMDDGIYYDTLVATNGCDSLVVTDLTVEPLPSVSINGLDSVYCTTDNPDTIIGTPSGGTFSGAGVTDNSFDPAAADTGTHAITYVYTDANGCTDSVVQEVIVENCVGINEFGVGSLELGVIPNPNDGTFELRIKNGDTFPISQGLSMTVYNVLGEEIHHQLINSSANQLIDLSAQPKGVYFLQIKSSSRIANKRIVIQ